MMDDERKYCYEIKHSINKRIGNAIESISCRLYYQFKKEQLGALFICDELIWFYVVFRLYRLKLLVIMSMRNRI